MASSDLSSFIWNVAPPVNWLYLYIFEVRFTTGCRRPIWTFSSDQQLHSSLAEYSVRTRADGITPVPVRAYVRILMPYVLLYAEGYLRPVKVLVFSVPYREIKKYVDEISIMIPFQHIWTLDNIRGIVVINKCVFADASKLRTELRNAIDLFNAIGPSQNDNNFANLNFNFS